MVFETCTTIDGESYRLCNTCHVLLRFDDERQMFNVTSKDGRRLLTDEIESALNTIQFKYFQDGYKGIYMWIIAPFDESTQDEIETIFTTFR